MKNLTFSLILTLAPFWISAQHLEVEGKVKISEMEKVNTADSLVVWLPGSIMGIRDASTLFRRLIDADQDTEITVEQSPDEDTIRFIVAGSEFATMDGKTLGIGSTGGSVYIGQGAGANTADSIGRNTFIGTNAGSNSNAALDRGNTFIGHASGNQTTTGHGNVAIGDSALALSTTGFSIAAVGHEAGMSNTGTQNTFIGYRSGKYATSSNSTFLGTFAGLRTEGNNNTLLGHSAGTDTLSGQSNTFVGSSAGSRTRGGSFNTFVGSGAGFLNINGHGNAYIGRTTGRNNNGSYNVAVGDSAMYFADTVSQMVAIGHAAGMMSQGSQGTFIGFQAGKFASGNSGTHIGYLGGKNNSGFGNTTIGAFAGSDTLTGSFNTIIGKSAGSSKISGRDNTFVGTAAGRDNTEGKFNAFFGSHAGSFNTTGDDNVFIGVSAGAFNDTASSNVYIGRNAGRLSVSGEKNVFIGDGTGFNNASGSLNTFVGEDSGIENTIGSNNTYLGQSAGFNNVSGSDNVYLGYQSGFNETTGSRNVFLGRYSGYFETGDDKLYIDNDSVTTPLIYGDFNSNYATIHGDLGINILNPDQEFVVFDTDNDGDAVMKLKATNSSNREMLIAVNQSSGGLISMETNNDLELRTNGMTRMTIEDGGNIGIGTSDPAFALHVDDPGTGGSPTINLVVEANTSNRPTILFSESGSTTGLNNGMSIEYNGEGTTDEMTINAVGGAPVLTVESTDNQVGIGTTNPDRELTVFDSDGNGDAVINVKDASHELFLGTNSSGISLRSLTNDDVSFWANNLRHMTIQPSGEVGIGITDPEALLEVNSSIVKKIGGGSWTASSDRRLKQNVVDYKEGLKELLMIRPVQFRYNNISGYNTMEEHIGVIAQELQDVTPHMVSTYGRDGTDYLQVDNSAMTYMLINAVKEQQILIEQLTTQNSALMTRMETLEGSIADDQASPTPNNEKP